MNQPEFEALYSQLIEKLRRCAEVTRYDLPGDEEAPTLALALLDLESSFRRFSEQHLPTLLHGDLSPAEIYDRLLSIGEELRHVLYHIRDPRFFRDLLDLPEPPHE